MNTIETATIIHQAAGLYIGAFEARKTTTGNQAAALAGQMEGIMSMVVSLGLNPSDVIAETTRIMEESK